MKRRGDTLLSDKLKTLEFYIVHLSALYSLVSGIQTEPWFGTPVGAGSLARSGVKVIIVQYAAVL